MYCYLIMCTCYNFLVNYWIDLNQYHRRWTKDIAASHASCQHPTCIRTMKETVTEAAQPRTARTRSGPTRVPTAGQCHHTLAPPIAQVPITRTSRTTTTMSQAAASGKSSVSQAPTSLGRHGHPHTPFRPTCQHRHQVWDESRFVRSSCQTGMSPQQPLLCHGCATTHHADIKYVHGV